MINKICIKATKSLPLANHWAILFAMGFVFSYSTSFAADRTILERVTVSGGYSNWAQQREQAGPDLDGLASGYENTDCQNPMYNEEYWTLDINSREVFDGIDGMCPVFSKFTTVTQNGNSKYFQQIGNGEPPCKTCSYSHPPYQNSFSSRSSACNLSSIVGSIEKPLSLDPVTLAKIKNMYNYVCGIEPTWTVATPSYGKWANNGEGSYTFVLSCMPDETAKTVGHLHTEATVRISALSPPTGKELLLNGAGPSYLENTYNYYAEDMKTYEWNGVLKWDIPLFRKCGSSVTLAPSTSAYAEIQFSTIKAVLDICKPIME